MELGEFWGQKVYKMPFTIEVNGTLINTTIMFQKELNDLNTIEATLKGLELSLNDSIEQRGTA